MPRKLIMCGDHPVLAFEYDPESGRACSSGEVLDHDRLPLEFTTRGKSALYAKRIDEWWRSRAIPSTRDGIRRVLESLGAASTGELLDRTYGLSLSDQYWVRREDDPAEWKDVNFFDNPFDEAWARSCSPRTRRPMTSASTSPTCPLAAIFPNAGRSTGPPAGDCSSSRAVLARNP